jgi:hypothetical protein
MIRTLHPHPAKAQIGKVLHVLECVGVDAHFVTSIAAAPLGVVLISLPGVISGIKTLNTEVLQCDR